MPWVPQSKVLNPECYPILNFLNMYSYWKVYIDNIVMFFDKIFKIFFIIFSRIRYIKYFKFITEVRADTLNLLFTLNFFDVFSCLIYAKVLKTEIFVRSFRIYLIYQYYYIIIISLFKFG